MPSKGMTTARANWLKGTEAQRSVVELRAAKRKIEALEKRNADLRFKLDSVEKIADEFLRLPPTTVFEVEVRFGHAISTLRRIRNLANYREKVGR